MRIDIRFSSCNHHPTTQLSLTSHSPQVRVEYHVVYRIYLLCAVTPGLRPGSTESLDPTQLPGNGFDHLVHKCIHVQQSQEKGRNGLRAVSNMYNVQLLLILI